MRHFISLLDFSTLELTTILDRADALKTAWDSNCMPQSLINRQVGLWFYGQGFRNRLAFEIGAKAMGASVSFIPGDLGVHEPLEDVGFYLENWYTMLIVRAKHHTDLLALADKRTIPVINARTEFSHPCEIMGDLQFIRRFRGSLDGLRVVFVGEVTNLCMSWFEAAARFPIEVTQIAPPGYEVPKSTLDKLNLQATGKIAISNDLDESLNGVDLIYTDCWPKTEDPIKKEAIRQHFIPYQITERHLNALHSRALFLPCPPVTRGEEVSAEAMQSEKCMNYAAKNYLLHAQNAIMEYLMA